MITARSSKPKSAPGLDISVMPDGYVVYDSVQDRIHYLNPSSALILELSDGSASVLEIAKVVQSTFDLAEVPFDDTVACVENLVDERLVSLTSNL